jgi:hypothetical protein
MSPYDETPMTERQARYLRELCEQRAEDFDPNLTKSEAHLAIKDRVGGWLSAVAVREACKCPWCGVENGQLCRRASGAVRRSNHKRRVEMARRLLDANPNPQAGGL